MDLMDIIGLLFGIIVVAVVMHVQERWSRKKMVYVQDDTEVYIHSMQLERTKIRRGTRRGTNLESLDLDSHCLWPSMSSSGFLRRLKNLEVIRGASAIFRCVLHDDTEETGQWFFNDVALTHSDKTQIAVNEKERQLTVTDVQFADTGKYEYRVGQDKTSAHLSLNEAMCVSSILNPPPPAIRLA